MPPRSPHRLPCRLDVPDAFVAPARHALGMLLLGLGLEPAWTSEDPGPGGLYYGPRTDARAGISIRLDDAAPAFFRAAEPFPPDRIREVELEGEAWPLPFGTGEAPDLVASAFLWLSGWQEATVRTRDQHGRVPYAASLQARLGTADRPAVDAYREVLAASLSAARIAVPRRRWDGRPWALCPTHDIDYLRKWRPGMIYREVAHHLVRNDRGEPVPERVRRFGRFLADAFRPGDVYRETLRRLPDETRRRGGTATFFFKTDAHGPNDVAYDIRSRYFRRVVARLRADGFEIGLHPSYHAHDHPARLARERDRLAAVVGETPTTVRQHYLRYEPGATARHHARAGFRIDSSLGWAERDGYRHATCHPFRLWDLDAAAPLDVWEVPLTIMDGTLFNRRHLDGDGARDATSAHIDTCRRFGGVLVGLWHVTVWDELDHPGWGRHFTETLDAAAEGGAAILSLGDALARWKPTER